MMFDDSYIPDELLQRWPDEFPEEPRRAGDVFRTLARQLDMVAAPRDAVRRTFAAWLGMRPEASWRDIAAMFHAIADLDESCRKELAQYLNLSETTPWEEVLENRSARMAVVASLLSYGGELLPGVDPWEGMTREQQQQLAQALGIASEATWCTIREALDAWEAERENTSEGS